MGTRAGGPPRRHLFVYYKLPADQVPAAAAAVHEAHDRLIARHPGLRAGLLQRPERGEGDRRTLMETYAGDPAALPDGVGLALQAEIEIVMQAALGRWLDASARHLEVFVDLPCAS